MTNDNLEILSKIPMFSELDTKTQKKLADITVTKIYHKGQILFREGTPADGLFIVKKGRIKIYKMSWEGKEQVLHFFGPMEMFAEVPVFQGSNYPASAEALEKSEVIFIPGNLLLNFLRENCDVAIRFLALLSERLRYFTRLIEDLSLKEVPARLAAYILYHLEKIPNNQDEITLDIPRHLLSALLGTTPETLSRVFTRMRSAGYIKLINKNTIKIPDKEKLQNLALEGKWIENSPV